MDRHHQIRTDAKEIERSMIEARRDFHLNPELSFKESRTAGIVADKLKALGMEVHTNIGGYGVVGELHGSRPGKRIALRADMDALPIDEQTGLPFASTTPGVMHACGHDAHTAILLGAAELIAGRRDRLSGSVRFLFQSAEEILAGAVAMIKDGAMEGVDEIYGLHNLPSLTAGKIAVKSGVLMAAIDRIEIRIIGKGGHGGYPDACCDPIVASSAVVMGLQQIVSREIAPHQAAVVSLGTIHGGTANNIIPDDVELTGTIRTMDPEVRRSMPERLKRIIEDICRAYRCTAQLTYIEQVREVDNDEACTSHVREIAAELFGAEACQSIVPFTYGEDFAELMNLSKGCFFWLGSGPQENPERAFGLHSSKLNVDESCLAVGAAMFAGIAIHRLAFEGCRSE
ncbi:M20 metallopeptidase family protein [Paenibacillus mendelii]|uniref:M20 family metallopeptidase n=1 Tax=Paenibacillus mendelii TaxID=206163 RepID=A0ABV6J8V0_9BACL|nr:amidohydrolase [Paenibacillus mendelii]MCQ6559646.1 amidohydrolase [Paenibacillus mendelii]